jgi:hypothetical protein
VITRNVEELIVETSIATLKLTDTLAETGTPIAFLDGAKLNATGDCPLATDSTAIRQIQLAVSHAGAATPKMPIRPSIRLIK